MDDDYKTDIRRCKRITDEIDRKHIAVYLGKAKINPGDPPPFKQELLDRVTSAASLANAVGLDIAPQQIPILRSVSKNKYNQGGHHELYQIPDSRHGPLSPL